MYEAYDSDSRKGLDKVSENTTSAMPKISHRTESVVINDVLEFYRRSVQLFSADDVFLLESLTGPEIDSRETFIGLTGAIDVLVFDKSISLLGVPSIVSTVRDVFSSYDAFTVTSDNCVTFEHPEAVWLIPKIIYAAVFNTHSSEQLAHNPLDLGLVTMLGYDSIFYIEQLTKKIPADEHPTPTMFFSLITAIIEIDKKTKKGTATWLVSDNLPQWDIAGWLACSSARAQDSSLPVVPEPKTIYDDTSVDDFISRVHVCKEHIRVGDIYQVQLGHKITIHSDASPIDVYQRLRERNPSPYMSILPLAGKTVIGASPELFIQINNKNITMRPIAGTTMRTGDPEKDEIAKKKILSDDKELAEHLMLVDLCRNDFGRVSQFGTIEVTDLIYLEEYSHVFHIVSHVKATMRDNFDAIDAIKATFPAGTMTGAPKIRAMEIIENLEQSRRGYYAGSFGIIRFSGPTVLGLAIRMTVFDNTLAHDPQYTLRASAGVVSDSIPHSEWRETLVKIAAPFWAVAGYEISKVYSL